MVLISVRMYVCVCVGGGGGNKKDYDSFSEAQYIFDELSIRSSYHPSVQVNQSVLRYFSIL